MNYAEKRKVEINQSKNRRKTKPREGEGEGSEVKSSYRAYSRMYCSGIQRYPPFKTLFR